MLTLAGFFLNMGYYIFYQFAAGVESLCGVILALLYAIVPIIITSSIVPIIGNLMLYRDSLMNDMNEIRDGIKKKIVMFILFVICCWIHFLVRAAVLAYLSLFNPSSKKSYIVGGIDSVVCFGFILFISMIFHPCFFNASFQLGQIGVFTFHLFNRPFKTGTAKK